MVSEFFLSCGWSCVWVIGLWCPMAVWYIYIYSVCVRVFCGGDSAFQASGVFCGVVCLWCARIFFCGVNFFCGSIFLWCDFFSGVW